jgi:hypothetical protein
VDIDHLDGREFLQCAARGQPWRQGMQATLERDLLTVGEECDERKSPIVHQALIPAVDGTSRSPTRFTRIAVVGYGCCIRG